MTVLAFCLVSTAASLFLSLAEGFVIPNINQWIHILLLGLVATLYQYCMSAAYKYAPAGELSIFGYSTIVFSAIAGIIIWEEQLVLSTIAGIVSIFAAGMILFQHENHNT